MRDYLWITAASLVLLGCAEDGTRKPTTSTTKPNSNTTTDDADSRTTVSKPAISGGQTPATSATAPDATAPDSARPDNSAVNKRDQDDSAVLPTDQSNKQEDLDISAKIRQNILRNEKLSANAENIKVITQEGGKVTLRGPVASEDEKKLVEQIAKDVAGADKVTNALEIAP